MVLEQSGDALLWRHLGLPVETTGLPPLASTRGAATFSLDEDVPFATAPGLGWFGPLAVSVAGRVLRWAVTDSTIALMLALFINASILILAANFVLTSVMFGT